MVTVIHQYYRRVDGSGLLRSKKVMLKSGTKLPRWAEKVLDKFIITSLVIKCYILNQLSTNISICYKSLVICGVCSIRVY